MNEKTLNRLARNVVRIRSARQLTQERLAEKSGLSQPYLSAIESGKKMPRMEVIDKLAKALSTKSSELLFGGEA